MSKILDGTLIGATVCIGIMFVLFLYDLKVLQGEM